MNCKWESFNDEEAQNFMLDLYDSFEHQSLSLLHSGYLECCGVLDLAKLSEPICPEKPIDMLCLYQAVAETFGMPLTTRLDPPNKSQTPDWVINMPEAIQFVAGVASEASRGVMRNFLAVVASNHFVSPAPFDVLFCCKLLAATSCREDILERIRTGAIRRRAIRMREDFQAWVDAWTGSLEDEDVQPDVHKDNQDKPTGSV